MNNTYMERLTRVASDYNSLIKRRNEPVFGNGIYTKYKYPVLTNKHIPPAWIYDLDPVTNPYFMERQGVNCVFNPGAIEFNGKICLVARVEGNDRKSFFAIAESDNGIDGFRFWDKPCIIPEADDPDTNIYDMRLTRHEDGWIYGLFCSERKDVSDEGADNLSAATAQCGIVRTRDLINWERLPDLVTASPQQRNVVLHREFVNGSYAFYTRPQDGFISAGSGGGIGWGLADTMEGAVITSESIIDPRIYHTIKEAKNGQGPSPVKSAEGWIHIAHGVRENASGLRYVIYAFMTALDDPSRVIYSPGGFLIAPEGDERVGDVSNVVFTNGLVQRENGDVLIYYASSDTRCHVAQTTVAQLVDYCKNTPSDPLYTARCVKKRVEMIDRNRAFIEQNGGIYTTLK